MSDYVFEINPDQYLYKANENKCFFVIHKCRLPGKNKDLFLVGDAFLRHFYSVYDFDQDQISLGINTHSANKVSMYKPGERPADLVKTAVEEDNVQVPTNNSTTLTASSEGNSTSEGKTTSQAQTKAEVNTNDKPKANTDDDEDDDSSPKQTTNQTNTATDS